jgi:hypothetical protein
MPTTGTVLAVGTTGRVGSMLIPRLCAAGVQVRALVRDETKRPQPHHGGPARGSPPHRQAGWLRLATESVSSSTTGTWVTSCARPSLPYTLLAPTFFIQKRNDGRADRGRFAPRRGARSDQSAGGEAGYRLIMGAAEMEPGLGQCRCRGAAALDEALSLLSSRLARNCDGFVPWSRPMCRQRTIQPRRCAVRIPRHPTRRRLRWTAGGRSSRGGQDGHYRRIP